MPRLSPIDLKALRWSVQPEYADASDEALEQTVESAISGLSDSTAEDFLKALNSIGQAVGPTLQRAAPNVVQGATAGATVGGPWGALLGAGAGLASGVLTGKGGKQTSPPVPPASASVPPTASGSSGPPALPTGQGAAATLLGLLQNPAIQQALMSQVLGASGNQQILTPSGTSVPRGAINGLLTQLLANASEGLAEAESISEQSYLQGEGGEYLIDPASPEQQAALVLSRLESGSATRFRSDSGKLADAVEWMEAEEWTIEELADSESEGWLKSEETIEAVRFY